MYQWLSGALSDYHLDGSQILSQRKEIRSLWCTIAIIEYYIETEILFQTKVILHLHGTLLVIVWSD